RITTGPVQTGQGATEVDAGWDGGGVEAHVRAEEHPRSQGRARADDYIFQACAGGDVGVEDARRDVGMAGDDAGDLAAVEGAAGTEVEVAGDEPGVPHVAVDAAAVEHAVARDDDASVI